MIRSCRASAPKAVCPRRLSTRKFRFAPKTSVLWKLNGYLSGAPRNSSKRSSPWFQYRAGVKCRAPFPSDLTEAKVFSVCSNWSSNRLDGSEGLQRVLELVVEIGAVEGAGAEIFVAYAGLPAEVAAPEVMRTVPEGLDGAEVAVQPTGSIPAVAVTALIPGRNAVETAPVLDLGRCRGSEGPEGTAFHAGGHGVLRSLACDDVDGT